MLSMRCSCYYQGQRHTYSAPQLEIIHYSKRYRHLDYSEQINKIKVSLKRRHIDYPLEFHIVSRSIYDRWYKKFLSGEELIRI